RARRRALADDEVELEILHGGIENFLHRRIEPVDLVDEQDVAVFEIGEQRREVAGPGDHRPRRSAEIDTELASKNLGERSLAQAWRPSEEHVIECFAASLAAAMNTRRLDFTLDWPMHSSRDCGRKC